MKLALTFFAAVLLAGCSSLPYCGSQEHKAIGGNCVKGIMAELAEYQAQNPNAFQAPPKIQPQTFVNQPVQIMTGPGSDGYQLVGINTPSGVIWKRCKVLNGKAAHCL